MAINSGLIRSGSLAGVWDDGTPVWDDGTQVWDIPNLTPHIIRTISGAINNAVIATAEADATVALAAKFIPLRNVVLAVSEANAVVALQSTTTPPIAGRLVQLAIAEANAVVALTALNPGIAVRNVTLSAVGVDMMGPMVGLIDSDDGFNASFNIVEANAVVAIQAHTTGPAVRNVTLATQAEDAVTALAATSFSNYAVQLATTQEDAVASFQAASVTPVFNAVLSTQAADAVASFQATSAFFGLFNAAFQITADDAVCSFAATTSVPVFNAQFDIAEADAVVRLFTSQLNSGGSWPGFSDKDGLRVPSGGRRGLLVESGKPENPPA